MMNNVRSTYTVVLVTVHGQFTTSIEQDELNFVTLNTMLSVVLGMD
jgi:hypothetical protein